MEFKNQNNAVIHYLSNNEKKTLVISEEIKNGLRMQWLIDGKQRLSTIIGFINNY